MKRETDPRQMGLGVELPVLRSSRAELVDSLPRQKAKRRKLYRSSAEVKLEAPVWVRGEGLPEELPGIVAEKVFDMERGMIFVVRIEDGKDRPPYSCGLSNIRPRTEEK